MEAMVSCTKLTIQFVLKNNKIFDKFGYKYIIYDFISRHVVYNCFEAVLIVIHYQ